MTIHRLHHPLAHEIHPSQKNERPDNRSGPFTQTHLRTRRATRHQSIRFPVPHQSPVMVTPCPSQPPLPPLPATSGLSRIIHPSRRHAALRFPRAALNCRHVLECASPLALSVRVPHLAPNPHRLCARRGLGVRHGIRQTRQKTRKENLVGSVTLELNLSDRGSFLPSFFASFRGFGGRSSGL